VKDTGKNGSVALSGIKGESKLAKRGGARSGDPGEKGKNGNGRICQFEWTSAVGGERNTRTGNGRIRKKAQGVTPPRERQDIGPREEGPSVVHRELTGGGGVSQ